MCLPAPWPASLGLHKRHVPGHSVHSLDLTGTLQGTRAGRCVQCLTVPRGQRLPGPSPASGAFGLLMTGRGAANSDGGGDNGSLCCPIHQCRQCQEIPVCYTERVCTQQCPGRNLTLAKQNDRLCCAVSTRRLKDDSEEQVSPRQRNPLCQD